MCSTTQTTIDLVLVSDKLRVAESGVINYGLSDNSIMFCTRKTKKAVLNVHSSIKTWSLKRYTKEALNYLLKQMDWSNVLQCIDVDRAWCSFKGMFLEAVDEVAPCKEIRIKQRTEPWVN